MISYVVFVLSLFFLHLTLVWCLGRAVLRICGISWVSSLMFLPESIMHFHENSSLEHNKTKLCQNFKSMIECCKETNGFNTSRLDTLFRYRIYL